MSQQSLYTPLQCDMKPRSTLDDLMKDAHLLEDEIEVLKWMARRKELEYDCMTSR